jgi:hypothetical protein
LTGGDDAGIVWDERRLDSPVMPSSTIPTKTPLGVDELRHRTRRLGQRHRTILLLIDGLRPLSEVLSLAQKAGATTSHFEDLMKLGLVELPVLAAAPESEVVLPAETPEAEVTSVELVVMTDEVAEVDLVVPIAEPVLAEPVTTPEEPAPIESQPEPAAEAVAAPVVAPPAPLPEPPQSEEPWVRTVRLRGPAAERPAPEPVVAPPIEAPADIPAAKPRPPRRSAAAANLPVLADVDEGAMLQQVRDLLVDTLRLDAPLFGARTFVRVRAAQTAAELIDLVWEIERHLSHARRSRSELQSLQRAREILGLGNTLAADENYPGFPED